ncbi:MAG: Gfo/Idh/MocA family oxidoreductase [Promethearchaeota archaeon]
MEPLRVGLIGTGNSGKNIAQAMASLPDVEIVGIASGHAENAQTLAEKHGVPFATGDYHELLEREEVEAVCVSVPHGLHHTVGMDVISAGKHLLLEKPMATTVSQCDELTSAARKAGVRLGVFFQKRFSPTLRKMKEIVESGLGRAFHADVHVKWFRDQEYYGSSSWRGTWQLEGGGCLMNQASHPIDLVVWMLGDVKEAYAHVNTVGHDIEVEDLAAAVLKFASGVTCTIVGSTAIVPGFPSEVAVHGTEGTVRLVGDDLFVYGPGDPPDKEPLVGASHANFADPTTFALEEHQALVRDFVAAVREGRDPLVSGEEGRKAVEVIRAIYKSATEGRVVTLPFDD